MLRKITIVKPQVLYQNGWFTVYTPPYHPKLHDLFQKIRTSSGYLQNEYLHEYNKAYDMIKKNDE